MVRPFYMFCSTSKDNVRVGDDTCEERQAGTRLTLPGAQRT